jgi:PilZ domain-containing protein
MDERRRSARLAVDGQLAMLPSNVDVQVLDISVAGVLLHTSQPLDPGTRGNLRLNLWGAPFKADVEVRRVSPLLDEGRGAGYGVGAVFVAILPEHRELIERFASH